MIELETEMWQTAVPAEIAGQKCFCKVAEYALVTALHHGFLQGIIDRTPCNRLWMLPVDALVQRRDTFASSPQGRPVEAGRAPDRFATRRWRASQNSGLSRTG